MKQQKITSQNSLNKHYLLISQKMQAAPKKEFSYFNLNKYLGSPHICLGLNTPTIRTISKEFKKEYKDISFEDFINVVECLYKGKYTEERFIASSLLSLFSDYKKKVGPEYLDRWLEELQGWAEIDTLCQSSFTDTDILSCWKKWEKALRSFSKSSNISKRRASLVLLVQPVSQAKDIRLSSLAFENIDRLKIEKDILITKAVSWLLRALTKNYRKEVEEYLSKNKNSLPAIAVRETTNKLRTGNKNKK